MILSEAEKYVGIAKDYRRVILRRFWPAHKIKAKNENEFLARLFAMTILTALLSFFFALLPATLMLSWFEAALLGMALSVVAARRSSSAMVFKMGTGLVFGVGLHAFVQAGYPLAGMGLLGLGIGALMSKSAEDHNVKVDVVIATIVVAVLGAWATIKLEPWIYAYLPRSVGIAVEGAIIGLFFSLGALPAHLSVITAKILIHTRRLRRRLKKEYHAHLDPVLDKYVEAMISMGRSSEDFASFMKRKTALEEALLGTAESCVALQQIEQSLIAIPENDLRTQELELRKKYESASDEGIKREIEKTLLSIEENLARLNRLKLESERTKLQIFRHAMNANTI